MVGSKVRASKKKLLLALAVSSLVKLWANQKAVLWVIWPITSLNEEKSASPDARMMLNTESQWWIISSKINDWMKACIGWHSEPRLPSYSDNFMDNKKHYIQEAPLSSCLQVLQTPIENWVITRLHIVRVWHKVMYKSKLHLEDLVALQFVSDIVLVN